MIVSLSMGRSSSGSPQAIASHSSSTSKRMWVSKILMFVARVYDKNLSFDCACAEDCPPRLEPKAMADACNTRMRACTSCTSHQVRSIPVGLAANIACRASVSSFVSVSAFIPCQTLLLATGT
eukprot:scaffold952_cov409-Prasinococcus_capsulatus_cf.AAC.22